MTGGTKKWHLTPQGSIINAEKSQYWYVGKGVLVHLQDVWSYNEDNGRSMGKPQAITDFIRFAYDNYYADNFHIIFWNHGMGSIGGYAHDEYDHSSLSLNDIYKAMKDAHERTGKEFELIGFDACLMATIETAYVMKDFGKYFVASEELEPGHGWNYEPIVGAFHDAETAADIDGRLLGEIIVDEYEAYCKANRTDYDITLSLTDLSKVDAVITALNDFVSSIRRMPDDDFGGATMLAQLVQARNRAESYGGEHIGYPASDMVDLWDLADKIKADNLVDSDKADALKNAVSDAVVHKVGSILNNVAGGLSVYYPARNSNAFSQSWAVYKELYFSSAYKEFVGRYLQSLTGNQNYRSRRAFGETGEEKAEPEVKKEERVVEISFNTTELPKITAVNMNFGVKDGETTKWLGSDAVALNREDGKARGTYKDRWYYIAGELVSLTTEKVGDKNLYLIDVLHKTAESESEDGEAAHLVYEQGENGLEFRYVRLKSDDKTRRVIMRELKAGDEITLIYNPGTANQIKGKVITINGAAGGTLQPADSNGALAPGLSYRPLIDGDYSYRFETRDLLNTASHSGEIVEAYVQESNITATPQLETEDSEVDTSTILIEGLAEPGANITISGGASLVNVVADSEGKFRVRVTLKEGAENTLVVKAKKGTKALSEAATVIITHLLEQIQIRYGFVTNPDAEGITVSDAIAVLRHIVGLSILDDEALQRAKVTGADSVSVADAIQILRFIVGLIDAFTVESAD